MSLCLLGTFPSLSGIPELHYPAGHKEALKGQARVPDLIATKRFLPVLCIRRPHHGASSLVRALALTGGRRGKDRAGQLQRRGASPGLSPDSDSFAGLLTVQTDRRGAGRRDKKATGMSDGLGGDLPKPPPPLHGTVAQGPGMICLPTNPTGMTSKSSDWLKMTC